MVWFHRGECPRCRGNLGDAWASVYDPDTPVCLLCHGREVAEQRGKLPAYPLEKRYWRPYDQSVAVKGIPSSEVVGTVGNRPVTVEQVSLWQRFGRPFMRKDDVIKIPGIPGVIHLKDRPREKMKLG